MPEMHRCPSSDPLDLAAMVEACLGDERQWGLAGRSLQGLGQYLREFVRHCQDRQARRPEELTPDFLLQYAEQRTHDCGPEVKKALVWSLRKFGNYLAVHQILPRSPAADLRHPEIPRRAKLPEYLTAAQLRQLLESAARQGEPRDFAILSLFAAAGLRPHEMAQLQRQDVLLAEQRIEQWVKGHWRKRTPLSQPMTVVLTDYLRSRTDSSAALFLTDRGKPITVSWVQRMVKEKARQAGLPFPVTCYHLRHTFATYAADRHGKLVTKTLLGHRLMHTTEVYAHLSPSRFGALMNRHPYQTVIRQESHRHER